eukprot:NODE_78_length_23230_cov_1.644979.p12 type:complete len:117 gc:universal NODE_78_length_23230_cov_1.644979:13501-13851(+)
MLFNRCKSWARIFKRHTRSMSDLFNDGLFEKHVIHVRVQQRNGRKTLTTVQGLPEDLDQKKMVKYFKKEFACNGTIVKDEDGMEIIQLSGDQRDKIKEFLMAQEICQSDEIKVHGF